jgi:hypothetical protein
MRNYQDCGVQALLFSAMGASGWSLDWRANEENWPCSENGSEMVAT